MLHLLGPGVRRRSRCAASAPAGSAETFAFACAGALGRVGCCRCGRAEPGGTPSGGSQRTPRGGRASTMVGPQGALSARYRHTAHHRPQARSASEYPFLLMRLA
eukprot:5058958-Prymnesium_polylepis.1